LLTFKNDVQIIKEAAKGHDELVNTLKRVLPPGTFMTQCLFRPIPTLFAQRSHERGGNVLGLGKVKEKALLRLITCGTETSEQCEIMRGPLMDVKDRLEKFGGMRKSSIDFQYLNYVDGTQNPLGSYGKDNVDIIRKVAAEYDPTKMFQTKVVSGWKISKVGSVVEIQDASNKRG
jgi:hypothetical protein